jgi:hypothetical protein
MTTAPARAALPAQPAARLPHVPAPRVAGHLAALVTAGLPSAGRPLDVVPAVADLARGVDLSRVRVHADGYAARVAERFEARALTVGRNVLLGAPAVSATPSRRRQIVRHELRHVAEQEQAGTEVVQLDAIGDVRKLLSYGLFDWAITDSEAMQALAILEAIPPADLPRQLAGLEQKYVDRLLDNLPDSAKTGPEYQRIIQALGPARTVSQAVSDLSYGLFDWAVTDADAGRVFNTFANLPAPQQEDFLVRLDQAGRLGRLMSNATVGHLTLYVRPWIAALPAGAVSLQQRRILRVIVENVDDLATLTLAAQTRFKVTVGPSTSQPGPVAWEPDRLRSTYLTLDGLPESHVANNAQLIRLGGFDKPAQNNQVVAGVYNPGARELNINATPSDDLVGTITHETGHAVDQQLGWTAGPEPAKPERGGWKQYGVDWPAAATDIVADAAGGISRLTAPQQGDVVGAFARAMGAKSVARLQPDVRALPWFAALPAATRTAVMDDRSFAAVEVGMAQPYLNRPDGGEHLGAHVYEAGYPPVWVRYEHQARARMVSPYQFRSPGEWFAEAYRVYYTPDPRGWGAQLREKDADTAEYFATTVDALAPSR